MDSVPFCKHATHKNAPGVNCSSSNTGKCLFFQMLQTRHLRPGFVKGVPDTVLLEDSASPFALSAVGAFCRSLCTQCCWGILPVPLHSVLLEDSAYPSALSAVGRFCLSLCTQCCWRILPIPVHSVLLEDSACPFALSAVGGFCLSQCTQCCPHGNQLNFAQHYQIWNKALSACAKSTNRGILALTKHHTNATTKTQLSTVTHAWHASKYKVHKLCQRYIF